MDDNFEQDYGRVVLGLLSVLKAKIALILVLSILSGVVGFCTARFLMPKRYEASVNMIVNMRSDMLNPVTSDNITSAQDLVDTYAIIIKSNKVLNQVIDALDLKMSYEELSEKISVDPIRSTQVMKIAAQCEDTDLAIRIVQTISEIAPDIVADAVEAGSCKVVSDVYARHNPVSPDVTRIVVLFAGSMFILACAVVVLRELCNDYIIDESDMEKKLGISVLGLIPDAEG